MSQVVLISALEGSVVLVLALLMVFLYWRKKHKLSHDLKNLTEDIHDRQPLRLNQLKRRLVEQAGLKDQGEQIADQLIAAEKSFLQSFLTQQTQHEGIGHFYEQLTELLDGYVNALTLAKPLASESPQPSKPDSTPTPPPETEQPPEPPELTKSEETDSATETKSSDSNDEEEAAPSWGDVFD